MIMSPNRWFPFEGHGMQFGRYRVQVPIALLPWLPSGMSKRFMLARNYWPHELRNMICNEGFTIRTAGFVWPVFEVFPWLPRQTIRRYRNLVPVLERFPPHPLLRRSLILLLRRSRNERQLLYETSCSFIPPRLEASCWRST